MVKPLVQISPKHTKRADYLKILRIYRISFETVELDKVIGIRKKLKLKLFSDLDKITSKLPKEMIEYIKYQLTHIRNRSSFTDIVSNQLKIAKEIPVFGF